MVEDGKYVIVTGGKGFIGGHLVTALLDKGYSVKVIDDERVGHYEIHHPNVLYIKEDVANYKLVDSDRKAEGIFHLANSPRVRRSLDYPVDTLRNNIDTTLNVIDMALQINCPLYFSTSSSTKYVESNNPYTLSKKMCEDLILMFRSKYKLEATMMYYYNVFGPGEADYGPYSTVIRRFKQKIQAGDPMVIFGDGSKRRAFTHVSDVVDGMFAMLDVPFVMDEVHLGNSKNVSILEIAQAFAPNEYIFEADMPGEAQETYCENPIIECKREVKEYIKEWVKAQNKDL
jgi:UDP-glucose 4-epimerase